MRVGMIWAEARGGAIGKDGDMPWHLPEDLAHFKRVTNDCPVVMGRRTWESLPDRFRPLPGRRNVVITRNAEFHAEGASVETTLEAALSRLSHEHDPAADTVWIMGGGQLYRSGMPLADELVVTRIDLDVQDADTFAPEIGPEWRLVDPGEARVSADGLGFRFERWVRRT